MEKQLSIIIPVYNVEKYIRACMESVLRQGLPEECYEIILVNDGTPDRSMEQIADIIADHTNITVINQENQGVSAARNAGLARATGEYILFIDADDLIVDDSLHVLLEKALSSKADMVVARFKPMSDNGIALLTHTIIQQDIQWEEKNGKELFMGTLSPNPVVWNRLHRRQFLQDHHILFIPDIIYEDFPFTYECYLKAKKTLRTNLLLNIYRYNTLSTTHRHITMDNYKDFSIAIGKTWNLSQSENLQTDVYKKLQTNVFQMFHYYINNLVLPNHTKFSDRIHAMDILAQNAPGLKFTNGKLQKLVSLLYSISPRLLMVFWILRWNWNHRK